MKFSFATSQVLHKQEISCMTFTCQSKSPQTKWARSSGTWCALQPPCVYGFSSLWNNNINVQCVSHTSLSQYTSCSVMWWLMRRGVNMLTANELAAAAPSSLSLISLFRLQPSTLFRVYLLSRKIVLTPTIQSPLPLATSCDSASLAYLSHTWSATIPGWDEIFASNGPGVDHLETCLCEIMWAKRTSLQLYILIWHIKNQEQPLMKTTTQT